MISPLTPPAVAAMASPAFAADGFQTAPNGLSWKDTKEGEGSAPESGATIRYSSSRCHMLAMILHLCALCVLTLPLHPCIKCLSICAAGMSILLSCGCNAQVQLHRQAFEQRQSLRQQLWPAPAVVQGGLLLTKVYIRSHNAGRGALTQSL